MVVAKKRRAQMSQRTWLVREETPSGGESGSIIQRGLAHVRPRSPAGATRRRAEFVGIERGGLDGDAVAGTGRRDVTGVADDARIDEVLVQVVDVLAHTVLEAAAHGDVVEVGEVLDVLAEAHAARVRTDGDAELGRHAG